MPFRILSVFLVIILTTGCGNPAIEQYANYEVFCIKDTNKLVKLAPINNAYYCKKGDQIVIKLQHIGPDRELLDWDTTTTNLETKSLQKEYSTPVNIPLFQPHTFITNTSGVFSITLTTWLAKRNIPMQSYKKLEEIRAEGKIILIVQEDQPSSI